MKKIVFIFFCYFYGQSNCTQQSDWLMDEGTIEISGMANDASMSMSSTNRTAKLRILRNRVKRKAAGLSWMEVEFDDGFRLSFDCMKTDGILIDNDTPVWRAERPNTFDEIIYTPIPALTELGKFEFCQNTEYKVAVAIFHDQQIVDTYIGNDHTMFGNFSLHKSRGYGKSSDYDTLAIRLADRVKRDTGEEPLRSDPPPETVYPQLLIQLDASDVRSNLKLALMRMLSYWNAVDLLYSSLEEPRIKFNIAGIIAPADNFSTPWATTAKNVESDNFIDAPTALSELGHYFDNYSHIFPEDEYDFMVSFVSDYFDENGTLSGITFINADCNDRSQRVSLIRNNLDHAIVGAHELAHLLSADHDDEIEQCEYDRGIMASYHRLQDEKKLEWSSCAKDSFHNYFITMRSVCLDNCPRTKQDCGNNPIPVHKFPCVRHPRDICRQTSSPDFTGHMNCQQGIICTNDERIKNFCARHPLSRIEIAFCFSAFAVDDPESLKEFTIPSEDGTICQMNGSSSISACYAGRCVPIDPNTPRC